jgi:hypothetical protein
MDEDTKAAFAEISAALGTINGLLGQIIENMATKTQFDALMQRMNNGFEHVANRVSAVEKRLDGVDLTLQVLTEQVRLSVGLLTDFGRRITDLEKKD